MKRGDWIRLRGRKIAHLVVALAYDGGWVIRACELNPLPDSYCTVDHDAPRCKKCLKAMEKSTAG